MGPVCRNKITTGEWVVGGTPRCGLLQYVRPSIAVVQGYRCRTRCRCGFSIAGSRGLQGILVLSSRVDRPGRIRWCPLRSVVSVKHECRQRNERRAGEGSSFGHVVHAILKLPAVDEVRSLAAVKEGWSRGYSLGLVDTRRERLASTSPNSLLAAKFTRQSTRHPLYRVFVSTDMQPGISMSDALTQHRSCACRTTRFEVHGR